jgi:hypothetical protein
MAMKRKNIAVRKLMSIRQRTQSSELFGNFYNQQIAAAASTPISGTRETPVLVHNTATKRGCPQPEPLS